MRWAREALLAVAALGVASCRDPAEPAVTRNVPLVADVVPAAGTERQITTDPLPQFGPAISGDRIVWTDYRTGNFDVYMFDLASGTERQITTRQITTDPSDQGGPAISGDRIVWDDGRSGVANHDIYMFDLASGTERQITTDPHFQFDPAISGDRIVWTDYRNHNADIYMFDLASGTERQITTDPNTQWTPAISGDRIVWEDTRNGNDDIYMFDLTTGTERQITTDPYDQVGPAISGDRIVWTDYRNGLGLSNSDIYLYDLANGTERRITTASTADSPAISGDRIVWTDTRNGTLDIYMFDLASGTERQITTEPHDQFDPAISGDRIVWTDYRNGNADIYMLDLATVPLPLAIIPPGPLTVPTDPGRCDAQVSLGTPTTAGGTPPVTLAPSPLPPYRLGETTVTWTATDGSGNTASATQIVTVLDQEAPSILAPPNISTVTDPGKPTASVNPGSATAADNCPGVTVAGARGDGQALNAPYPVGQTHITWTATDAASNSSASIQTITVVDQEPPRLILPADVQVNATSAAGAVVSYVASASDNVAGVVPVSCRPASGSSFPIGTTTVTCVATDPSGNQTSGSFHVIVLNAQGQISNVANTVASLGLPSGTATSLTTKLNAALAAANAGDVATACARLQDFINETQAQAGKKISQADATALIAEAQRIRAVLGC